MADKERKKHYDIEYAKAHLKRIPLDVQLDKYEDIKKHARAQGESVNGFVKRAIDETMERDNSLKSNTRAE